MNRPCLPQTAANSQFRTRRGRRTNAPTRPSAASDMLKRNTMSAAPPKTPKQRAAEAALDYIRSDTVIGLGTGSTADCFLIALAEALESGRFKDVGGVPTSEHTARQARELGIPVIDLADVDEPLDVTVDGADEVAPNLDLIKGLGGALLREKIVAQNSKTFVVIA